MVVYIAVKASAKLVHLRCYYQPAFVSDGCSGRGHRPVRCKLHEQVAPGAEDALVGQILHLVGVVHRGRVDVVAVFNQEPKKKKRKKKDDTSKNKF